MEEIKAKRPYPKRMYYDDAFFRAIVILKDCGGISDLTITRLLKQPDSHKRNIGYYYKRDKDKFHCARCEQLKSCSVGNKTPENNDSK